MTQRKFLVVKMPTSFIFKPLGNLKAFFGHSVLLTPEIRQRLQLCDAASVNQRLRVTSQLKVGLSKFKDYLRVSIPKLILFWRFVVETRFGVFSLCQ